MPQTGALFLARPYLSDRAGTSPAPPAQGFGGAAGSPDGWGRWPPARREVAAAQIFCMLDGIEVGAIDGLMGPQTRHAFEVYAARKRGIEGVENWRDDSAPPKPRREAPGEGPAGKENTWPHQSQRSMEKFYGPVGANQGTLELPQGYPMRIAWDLGKPVKRFSCHERICAPARRVLVRVLDHYGPARIAELGLDRFGGCLNVRRMRGGSAWSTHAWGAALDFDPERNQLKWNRKEARFARTDYDHWWSLWEAEGFVSLGRARDFDWMHVQAARL